jgi:hemerythrin
LEHEHLLQEIFRINALWEKGATADDAAVMAFLQEWLQKHILEFDKAYVPHLAVSD